MSNQVLLKTALLISFVATSGSLFFSEVMSLPPCVLCWYQRILMYPLILIFSVGLFRNIKESFIYGLTLSVFGLVIASYHNLLYYHLIPESITPCTSGVSCTSRQIEWFGFVTIPLLSLIAFILITGLGILVLKNKENK
ncbi:disulfide bond formation protein B [Bdellovibrio sp. qaytius]|nr:disulfide bond formation protein B [Bdellovibrio sp. qaytius]